MRLGLCVRLGLCLSLCLCLCVCLGMGMGLGLSSHGLLLQRLLLQQAVSDFELLLQLHDFSLVRFLHRAMRLLQLVDRVANVGQLLVLLVQLDFVLVVVVLVAGGFPGKVVEFALDCFQELI